MKHIRDSHRLSKALARYQAIQARRNTLEARLESLRQQIISWYEKNNRTQFTDTDGYVWRKQQGSSVFYDDTAFKELLLKRNIPVELVYKTATIEERDEEAIKQLLIKKKITVKEWRKVATIHYHKPYVRRFAPSKEESKEGAGL